MDVMPNSPVTFKTHVFNIKYKTIYVVKRKLKRILVEKLHLNRTNNYPYISGDGFRNLAQHIYDESSDFHPENVQIGDIIFMNPDFIEDYFTHKHPHIKHKYILITQNSDLGIEKRHTDLIDDKIAHWFAKNVLHGHPKVTPIPIGLTNNFLNKIGKTSDMSTIRATDLSHKTTGISFGFSLASGQERIKLQESLKKHMFGFHVFEKTQSAYFKKMSTYSFVASVTFYGCGYRNGALAVANGDAVVVLMPDGTKVVSPTKDPHRGVQGGLEKAVIQEVPHGP
jgi:hypothetical protein